MISRLLITVISLLILTGCIDSTADLENFVAETQKRQRSFVDPLPEFVPYQSFTYHAEVLRDPFVSQQQSQSKKSVDNGITPDAQRRKEPLEQFPLDTLKMVGILEQNQTNWGLIQAPDGTIHKVLAGNHLGENDGKIISVSEQKISIKEIVNDGLGNYVSRNAALVMGNE
ncbi:MAG: pilus assembly protein PilP [Gammaproteobacteria bacterium]|nr:pilus assembly protein PilP [Gammaproteobacteria bacterium]